MSNKALRQLLSHLGSDRYGNADHDRALKALRREAPVLRPHEVQTYRVPYPQVPEAAFAPDGAFAFVCVRAGTAELVEGFDARTGLPRYPTDPFVTKTERIEDLRFVPGQSAPVYLEHNGAWHIHHDGSWTTVQGGKKPRVWTYWDNGDRRGVAYINEDQELWVSGEDTPRARLVCDDTLRVGDGPLIYLDESPPTRVRAVVGDWEYKLDFPDDIDDKELPSVDISTLGRVPGTNIGRLVVEYSDRVELVREDGCNALRRFLTSGPLVRGWHGRLYLIHTFDPTSEGPPPYDREVEDIDTGWYWRSSLDDLLDPLGIEEIVPLTAPDGTLWYAILAFGSPNDEEVHVLFSRKPNEVVDVVVDVKRPGMQVTFRGNVLLMEARRPNTFVSCVITEEGTVVRTDHELVHRFDRLTILDDGTLASWHFEDGILAIARYALP